MGKAGCQMAKIARKAGPINLQALLPLGKLRARSGYRGRVCRKWHGILLDGGGVSGGYRSRLSPFVLNPRA